MIFTRREERKHERFARRATKRFIRKKIQFQRRAFRARVKELRLKEKGLRNGKET